MGMGNFHVFNLWDLMEFMDLIIPFQCISMGLMGFF